MKYRLVYVLIFILSCSFSWAQDSKLTLADLYRVGLEEYQAGNYNSAAQKFERALPLVEVEFGKGHLNYAGMLNNLAAVYQAQGNYVQAGPLFREAVDIYEEILGREHPYYATALTGLATFLKSQGDYEEAEKFSIEVMNIRENYLGRESPEFATSLNNIASIFHLKEDFEQARSLYQESMSIREKVLGEEHPDYANSLVNLAALYQDEGDYIKAESLYLKALIIREKVLGNKHPDYAFSLNGLASLYQDKGAYKKAEHLYLEALIIRENALGNQHPDYATSLNNLAGLYQEQGKYLKVESIYKEVISIYENVFGNRHLDYAISLSNLGGFYLNQGSYEEAELLYEKAREVKEEVLGKQGGVYARSLYNQALLFELQGNHPRAKILAKEASVIWKRALGDQHPDYARSINFLAGLHRQLGEYREAEKLGKESIAILRKALGEYHPDYASALNSLAMLYHAHREFDKAEQYYKEASESLKKTLGEEHHIYANSLNNLARLYSDQAEYGRAASLYREALSIIRVTLGKDHLAYAISLNNVALLYRGQGYGTRASPLFTEALDIFLLQFDRNFSHLSEKEKDKYSQTFDYNFELFHSFVVDHAVDNPELLANDFDYLLATKGLLFDFSEKIRDRVLSSSDTAMVSLYKEWRDQGQYVNGLYRVPEQKRKEREIDLKKEAEQLNKLEKELSARSALFASDKDTIKYTWQDVQGQLLPGEAAVEMVRFRYHKKEWTDSVIYMALVVTPETEGHPELVVLPDGNKLEGDYLSTYRRKLKKAHKDTDSFRHYWAPLSEKLQGVKKIYFSGDGVYHNISLVGLYDTNDGKYLADKLSIHRVSGTDQLLKEARKRKPENKAYLVGAPSFNKPEDITEAKNWVPLPYTLEEVDTLETILQEAGITTAVFTKDNATEEEVKNWDNPRIVHLATHAFFLEDNAIRYSDKGLITGLDQSTLYQNPLLRSVMLLANAKGELYGEGTSGALSANEVLNLKLDQTELVVLSACETGTGVIKNGEGIYGLQRAFLTSGAETVLASLWKVDDEVTQELMAVFYKAWLLEGLTKREAFRKARQHIKNKYGAPRHWAAFVLID